MNEKPIETHHDYWRSVGDGLVATYKSMVGSDYLDTGMKGSAGEDYFRAWMSTWLPKRVCLHAGAIIDRINKPTTQRDVVVFDEINCPVFPHSTGTKILPIEGVIGCIEVNTSVAKTEKLLADAAKIVAVKKLVPVMPPGAHVRHLVSPKYLIEDKFQEHPIRGQSFGYIFAYDAETRLETLAEHIAAFNFENGVDQSVDAVFVLKKGYIIHGIEGGWTTVRMGGSKFYHLEAQPWDVLLTLTALLMRHLGQSTARGHLPEPEGYFAAPGGGRGARTLTTRKLVEVANYNLQASTAGFQRLQ